MLNFTKNFIVIFVPVFLTSCIQEAAKINYKEKNNNSTHLKSVNRYNNLQPSYMKGTYIKSNNSIVRDLKKTDNYNKIDNHYNEDYNELEQYEKKYTSTNGNKNVKIIKAQKGDNLLNIARKYNMTLAEIAELNKMTAPYNIYAGQKIKIHNQENIIDENSVENKSNISYKTITIKPGDNLTRISFNSGITLRELAEINNIKPPYKVYVGQKIKVPSENIKNSDYYIVQKGDNLFSISKKNNIKFTELVKYNNLKKPYSIYVGQKIYLSNKNNDTSTYNKSVKKKENSKNISTENKSKRTDLNNYNYMREITDNRDTSFIWPVRGAIIKKFGKQENGEYSDAINIQADYGTNILATDEGEVAYAGSELKGYGNMIIIKHNNGWLSIYGHCETINVKVKEKVDKGQIIATIGKTGNVNEPQLYFAIRKGKIAMDPLKYLSNN